VDLVNEEHGALALFAESIVCARESLAHVLHATRDGRQTLGRVTRRIREDARQRRLTGAGRAPQDHGRQFSRLDETP